LEEALLKLAHKDAYDLAEAMNPEYVQHKEFQLKFLRADRFVAKNAALRLARHFQAKLELFGRYKLTQDIVQDDLDEDDISALYSGFVQLLPMRDRAGRGVAVWFPNKTTQAMDCEAKVLIARGVGCIFGQCLLSFALGEKDVAIYCFLISFYFLSLCISYVACFM
jgi:hypothetical protein